MSKDPGIASAVARLFQPERGLYLAPIRHHSPACAWAVRQMIFELKPRSVLIEAPVDFERHVPVLLDPRTRPPVAIVSLLEGKDRARAAGYFPFCAHSPELVAMQAAQEVGAEIGLIDVPASDKVGAEVGAGRAIPLASERPSDGNSFVSRLCARTGCRDGFELWDHLFETRLGGSDWRSFLRDVGAYGAGMRAATAQAEIEAQGYTAREAHMSARIAAALAAGPIVAVIGGFHAPALLAPEAGEARPPPPSRSYAIRYGFAELDALNGYAAGLPLPGYYDALWRRAMEAGGAPDWSSVGLDLLSGFASKMRREGYPISVPAQVELLRVAEGLAHLRGRPGGLRHDLLDATRSVLAKGEAGGGDAWTERFTLFLRGSALGDLPESAGALPLVEDVRARARSHRIDLEDGARKHRRLDVRRRPNHLAASRFFHALALLGAGFARCEQAPDLLGGAFSDVLFEDWSYAWSPQVEARLMELAPLGDRLDVACLALLQWRRTELIQSGRARDLGDLTTLLVHGLLAGLGRGLGPYLAEFAQDLQAQADFAALADTLRRLTLIAGSSGPLRPPEELAFGLLLEQAYRRLVYLCDDLPQTPDAALGATTQALRIVSELLADEAAPFDAALFDRALERVAHANPPPMILGAILGLATHTGRSKPARLVGALRGAFGGSVLEAADRVRVLQGVLLAAPLLVLRSDEVLGAIDEFLAHLDEGAFLELLPHLRLALSALNPRETGRLAELLARRHGRAAGSYVSLHTTTASEAAHGAALDQAVRAALAADGLQHWSLP